MTKNDDNFSFKNLFVPLTTLKAIHLIVLIGIIVFINCLFNGFAWEDKFYILQNPDVLSHNFSKVFTHSFFNSFTYYRAIPALHFTFLHLFFNDAAFFYHVPQVTFHIINASLVFFLFKRVFDKTLALFLALIFLVHPMQVESIAWINHTITPLFFFFGMTALLLSQKATASLKRLTGIFLLVLLSLMTKEVGFLFLFLIVTQKIINRQPQIGTYLFYGLTTTLVYFFMRFVIAGVYFIPADVPIPIQNLSLTERLMNVPAILYYYLKTFVFPVNLAILQQWTVTTFSFDQFYMPLIVVCIFFLFFTLLGIYFFKISDKKLFHQFIFFTLWFFCGLLISLQIVPLDMTVADRWFYFPLVGLLGIVGFILQFLLQTFKFNKIFLFLLAAVIIILFSIRTMIRTTNWNNSIALYSHDIKISDNFNIRNLLASEYFATRDYNHALINYEKAAEFLPNSLSYANIAITYNKLNNVKKAEAYYIKAIKYNSIDQKKQKYNLSNVYQGLAQIFLTTERLNDAKKTAYTGLKADPNSGKLWLTLTLIEYKLHNQNEALYAAKKAKTFLPGEQSNYIYRQIQENQPIKYNNNGSQFIILP